ncbi:MAG: tetratricopeptide repeat protein [Hyphomicrobiales bacterium]
MLPRRIVSAARTRPAALFAALLVSLAALALPVGSAAGAGDRDPSMVPVVKPIDLDGLFAKLKQAPDVTSAAITSHAIEQRWARSGSDTADLLMQRAVAAAAAGDRPLAIEILDRVIALEPDWAEAWNRRATVFFLEDDLSRSVADIEEVLLREPRQYAALMGLAGILERVGDERKALQAYERVLTIYPLLPSAQKGADRLRAKFGDVPI